MAKIKSGTSGKIGAPMSPASSSYGSTISGVRVRRAIDIVMLIYVALMAAMLTASAIMSAVAYPAVAVVLVVGLGSACVVAARGVRRG